VYILLGECKEEKKTEKYLNYREHYKLGYNECTKQLSQYYTKLSKTYVTTVTYKYRNNLPISAACFPFFTRSDNLVDFLSSLDVGDTPLSGILAFFKALAIFKNAAIFTYSHVYYTNN